MSPMKDPRTVLAILREQMLAQPGLSANDRAGLEARFVRFEPQLLAMLADALQKRAQKSAPLPWYQDPAEVDAALLAVLRYLQDRGILHIEGGLSDPDLSERLHDAIGARFYVARDPSRGRPRAELLSGLSHRRGGMYFAEGLRVNFGDDTDEGLGKEQIVLTLEGQPLVDAVRRVLQIPLAPLSETVQFLNLGFAEPAVPPPAPGTTPQISPAPDPRPIGRSDYAERLEGRRERLEAGAARQRQEAAARTAAFHRVADNIPLGQPILVGHHSEKRHRRDIERMHANLTKAGEAERAAQDLSRRAASIGTGGISSDDPEALVKLRAQLAAEEAQRDAMKAVNAAYKKGGWARVKQDLPDLDPALIARGERYLRTSPGGTAVPFPPFSLTNLGANIRRLRERVETLEKERVREDFAPIEGTGWSITEDRDMNRLVLRFDQKPQKDVLDLVGGGWHWSRQEGAHLRMSTPQARSAAKYLAAQLRERLGGEAPPAAPAPPPAGQAARGPWTRTPGAAPPVDVCGPEEPAIVTQMRRVVETQTAAKGIDLASASAFVAVWEKLSPENRRRLLNRCNEDGSDCEARSLDAVLRMVWRAVGGGR